MGMGMGMDMDMIMCCFSAFDFGDILLVDSQLFWAFVLALRLSSVESFVL